jgi:hypothetical protein
MDADFVNAYIERLNATVHDLQSKNIILETRVLFAEKRAGELQTELDTLKAAQEEKLSRTK